MPSDMRPSVFEGIKDHFNSRIPLPDLHLIPSTTEREYRWWVIDSSGQVFTIEELLQAGGAKDLGGMVFYAAKWNVVGGYGYYWKYSKELGRWVFFEGTPFAEIAGGGVLSLPYCLKPIGGELAYLYVGLIMDGRLWVAPLSEEFPGGLIEADQNREQAERDEVAQEANVHTGKAKRRILLTESGLTSAYRSVGQDLKNGISAAAYEYRPEQIVWHLNYATFTSDVHVDTMLGKKVVFYGYREARRRMRGSDHLAALDLLLEYLEKEGSCQVSFKLQ